MKQMSSTQAERWKGLCDQVTKGKLTATKSWKFAQINGTESEDEGYKGSFKRWVQQMASMSWLPANTSTEVEPENTKPIEQPKRDYTVPIVIGVGVGLLIILALATKTKK